MLGLDNVWQMTPRQLSAFERLAHWESEEYFAAMASAIRVAHHGDKDGFKKYIDSMTK
jgi:hypothetical protein